MHYAACVSFMPECVRGLLLCTEDGRLSAFFRNVGVER